MLKILPQITGPDGEVMGLFSLFSIRLSGHQLLFSALRMF
jgi:hypothetical protein